MNASAQSCVESACAELKSGLGEVFLRRALDGQVEASAPLCNLQDLFDRGLCGLTISPDKGGLGSGPNGASPYAFMQLLAKVAEYCLSTAHCVYAHYYGAHIVDQLGDSARSAKIALDIAQNGKIICFASSELGRKGVVGSFKTQAAKRDGGYVITGTKSFATLAASADYLCVTASLSGASWPDNVLVAVAEAGAPGLRIEKGSWNLLGMRAAVSPTVVLEECFVEAGSVLGAPGDFHRRRWPAKSHVGFAAQYLGAARGLCALAGRAVLGKHMPGEALWARLGKLRAEAEAVDCLMARAGEMWRSGAHYAGDAAAVMARCKSIELADRALSETGYMLGAGAFSMTGEASLRHRDLRLHTLHETKDEFESELGRLALEEARSSP